MAQLDYGHSKLILIGYLSGHLFTTYLIRRTRRRGISGIMSFVDDYSNWPTYYLASCPCLSATCSKPKLQLISQFIFSLHVPIVPSPHHSFLIAPFTVPQV